MNHVAAVVRVGGQSGCSVCDSGNGCGAGLFGRLLRRRPLELELPGKFDISEGQAVILGIPENQYLRLVARLFGWPLIVGLFAAALAQYWAVAGGLSRGQIDLVAALGGLSGAAAALNFWARASKPNISTADIRLMTPESEFPACDAPVSGLQINEKEV